MYIRLRVKYRSFLSDFNKNLPAGSRVVPCGRRDRQTDMAKIIVVFRKIANALKIHKEHISKLVSSAYSMEYTSHSSFW
jgi:hypothetical protein